MTAIQAVADRVSSWQDGATEGTVEDEVRRGVNEVGVDLSDDDLHRLVEAIEERHGAVDVNQVLSGE